MDGQISLDEFMENCATYTIKRLIYSQSLTCYKTICPYCRIENPDSRRYGDRRPLNICKSCGKRFDDVNIEIKKSKEYEEVEKLGLQGAVYKDEKGRWREWQDPYAKRTVTE